MSAGDPFASHALWLDGQTRTLCCACGERFPPDGMWRVPALAEAMRHYRESVR